MSKDNESTDAKDKPADKGKEKPATADRSEINSRPADTVTCRVLKNRVKLDRLLRAKGSEIELPVDKAKTAAAAGLVEITGV